MAVGAPSCIQFLYTAFPYPILAGQWFHGLKDGMPIAFRLPLYITENCTARATTTTTDLEEGYEFDTFDSSAADCVRIGHYRYSHTVALDQAVVKKRRSAAPDETARHCLTRGG